jgi:hypothetical protein
MANQLDLPKSELTAISKYVEKMPKDQQREILRFVVKQIGASQRTQLAQLFQIANPGLADIFERKIRIAGFGDPYNAPVAQDSKIETTLALIQGSATHAVESEASKKYARIFLRRFGHGLRNLICGNSKQYAKDRKQLSGMGQNAVTIGVPVITTALGLPALYTGVAIAISLLIARIGLKAFCEMLDSTHPVQATPKRKVKPTKKKLDS